MSHQFLIKSEVLENLRENFTSALALIKQSISESRPIIIRHHSDCDGYSGAIALEKNILPLILEKHSRPGSNYIYYKRAPMPAPFYDYSDAVRDLSFSLRDNSKFGTRMPLMILLDNGSTEEDIMGIKKLRIYGIKVIVIDHHFTSKGIIDDFVDVHINPYLAGGDSNLTSGMLAVELARLIDKYSFEVEFLAALSGVGDRSSGSEFDQYLEIASKHKYSLDSLKELAEALDFEAHHLRVIEGRELVSDLLGNDKNKQRKIIGLVKADIKFRRQKILEGSLASVKKKDVNGIQLVEFNVLKVTVRGQYPPVGKTVGMVFDSFKENPTVVLGYGDESITVRSNCGKFTVQEMLKHLEEKIPQAYIRGGGHENAGTIKFLAAFNGEVVKLVSEFLTTKLK